LDFAELLRDSSAALSARPVLVVVAVLLLYLLYRFRTSLRQARLRLEVERAFVYDLQATLDLHGLAQEALAHQALHDTLTGLPNRALLLDRLSQAIVRSERTGTDTAVLFLDLDRFTWVNDSLGHAGGDELLVAVADRLRSQLRSEDTLARFGDDEFVVLCDGLRFGSDAVQTADRLVAALSVPFHLGDRTISVTASIGIAHASTTPEGSAGEILRDADSAMHRAKDGGRNRMEVFDEGMRLTAMARCETESALRRGIDEDRFKVFYQPIIELGTGRVVGTEALVRWDRGDGDLIAPQHFIPLAEETGLIVPIGGLVLREACRQTVRWNETICQDQPLMVAVNISPRQLATAGLVDLVAEVLADSTLPPARLCLEITETVLIDDAISSETTLAELKHLGVHIAIDDFGTGYSSLRYLRRLPIDVLKIDRSFIAGLGENAADTAIVNGVLGLARSLGLRTVAEGVEHPDQATTVTDLGCEFAQGFLWSQPVPPTAFAHWLGERAVPGRPRPAGELAQIPFSDARR
jgi:diguanylate cyclase (GGDEF)-like protein